MKPPCPGSVGLLVLGRVPGDELKIISIIEEALSSNGCESVRFNGWILSCCRDSMVKAYAVLDQAGIRAVTPKVRVTVEGVCSDVILIVRLLAEAAQRSGYPTLMMGQESLVEGGFRLG